MEHWHMVAEYQLGKQQFELVSTRKLELKVSFGRIYKKRTFKKKTRLPETNIAPENG